MPLADGAARARRAHGVTDADVSNAAFPFGACREIAIAGVPLRALRITYVGELGLELHMPAKASSASMRR